MRLILILIFSTISGYSVFSQSIIKEPYLLYPDDNTKMTIMWQANSSGTATFSWGETETYENSVIVSEYGNDHQFTYTLINLTPQQKYYYKVELGSAIKTGSFITAPDSNNQNLTFFIYGDTKLHPEIQNMVTGRILTEINNDPDAQSFCLFTGDAVNIGNVESEWQDQFFNTAYSNNNTLKSKLPYILVRGNHENINSNYLSENATVFYKYWPYSFASGSSDGDDMYHSFDYGPVHIAVLDQYDNGTFDTAQISTTQLSWLENDLASSNKEWKFILLHEPGWSAKSISKSEHENNSDIQNNIQPLCIQYNIKAVFGGHNHYYAHCIVDNVNHFTLGGGGAPLYSPSYTSGGVIVYAESAYHFMKVQIQEDTAVFKAIKPDGSIIETTKIGLSGSNKINYINKRVKIYPNPSSGIYTIQTKNLIKGIITVFDITGQKKSDCQITSNKQTVNLSNFSKGIYFLKIKKKNIVIQKRIILM